MKQLWLGLLALMFLALPAQAQSPCDQATSFSHINATGPVEIAPPVASKRVYLCGMFIVQKGNTLDLNVLVGHGTNCADDQRQVMRLEFPNDVAVSNRIERVGPVSDAGYAMCIQTTGSNAKLGGVIYWAQF